ncbi:MAG: endonuclease/exonuclease/phosphatase family protein [Bacteroidota bacterium]
MVYFRKAIILLSIIIFLVNCSSKKTTPFTVMTWNIWHGGLHGHKTDNFEKDSANTLNVLKVLNQEKPDILFMQETYCCGMEIAKSAGFQHSVRGSSNLSIHSKYPIVEHIEIFKPFNSHAAIVDIGGQSVLCVNIWLHYLPDYFQDIKSKSVDSLIIGEGETRLKEISAITKAVDSLKNALNMPVIIGGDFNSGSHLDWIENTRTSHYGKAIEWPVSKLMIDHGFKDSFRVANPDPANSLQGTWGFLNDDIISDRIDYIYFKGDNITTAESGIIMDDPEGGFFNSDHRAILTKFVLTY